MRGAIMADMNANADCETLDSCMENSIDMDAGIIALAGELASALCSAKERGIPLKDLARRYRSHGAGRVKKAVDYLACGDMIAERNVGGVNIVYFSEYAPKEKTRGRDGYGKKSDN